MDEGYYKLLYNIPHDFDTECYLKKYNNNNLIHLNIIELYKFYNINKDVYSLDEEYYKLLYNIPHDFNTECYLKRYNNNNNNNNDDNDNLIYLNTIELYKFYNINKDVYSLDEDYYKILYNIPHDFDTGCYLKRYNNNNLFHLNTFDLYKFYNINKNDFPLDEEYYKILCDIPHDFDTDCYLKRYNNNNNNNLINLNTIELYKFYNKNKDFSLDEDYYKILYNIPYDFDNTSFLKRYNNDNIKLSKLNTNEICNFYNINKHDFPLDEEYYKILYNIPHDFDTKCYLNRYNNDNNNLTRLNTIDLYKFYNKNHDIFLLDEEYYKLLYNIPRDFDIKSYINRYNDDKNNLIQLITVDLYKFYNKNKDSFSLDEEYYKILYDIPHDFDTKCYLKRYNKNNTNLIHLITVDLYKFYSKNKEIFSLDEKYYKILYNIPDDFNVTIYLNSYYDEFSENYRNINDVFKHYHLKKYENISKNNVKYYKNLYNINEEFDYIKYLKINQDFIFNNDIQYVFKVYKKIILLEDIYECVLKNNNNTNVQLNFIDNYKFLINNFPQIVSEDDKRYYISLKGFVTDYYLNNKDEFNKYKIIETTNVIETIVNEPIEKIVKRERKQIINADSDLNRNEEEEELNKLKLFVLQNNINIDTSFFNLNTKNLVKQNKKQSINSNKEIIEYYDEKITEYIEKKITQNVVVETKEKIYNSFGYNFEMKSYDEIYNDIKFITSNLYFTYRLKNYYNHVFDTTDKIKIHQNNDKCAIFYTFNEYPHTYDVFKNNLLKLGDDYSHIVVCSLNNENYIKTIIGDQIDQIKLIVLPYNNITYNEFNNTLLSKNFWNNINYEEILLHNENTFILENKFNNFSTEDCLGYKLPNVFTYNKYTNGYSEISLRKKKEINKFLDNIDKITINNKLCMEIKEYFTLDKFPEDILYSKYIFDISKKTNDNNSSFREKIQNFDNTILIINYKFLSVNTKLSKDINEFIKNKYNEKLLILRKKIYNAIL